MSFHISLYLVYSTVLFIIATIGLFYRSNNIITMLMCLEMMLLAVNLNLIIFSTVYNNIIGHMFVLLVITVAAAESAIGLAIIIIYHRLHNTTATIYLNLIKG